METEQAPSRWYNDTVDEIALLKTLNAELLAALKNCDEHILALEKLNAELLSALKLARQRLTSEAHFFDDPVYKIDATITKAEAQ